MKAQRALLVFLPLLGGCTLLLGNDFHVGETDAGGGADAGADGGTPIDAGDLDAGPGVDAGDLDAGPGPDGSLDAGGPPTSCDGATVPAGAVIGFSFDHWVTETGEEPRPLDLSGYTIQAYVPDASADGFDVVDGAGTAEGTFRIDGVPEGVTFYLKLLPPGGLPLFYVTDLRCLDGRRYTGGRPDAVPVAGEQLLELHLTDMQPWGRSDWLIAEVLNTTTELWELNRFLQPPPTVGSTTVDSEMDLGLCGLCYSANPLGRPMLVDHTRGDVLQLGHARRTLQRDFPRWQEVTTTVDVLDVTDVTMTPGATTVVNAAFRPVPADRMVRFTLNRAAFDAAYPDGTTWIETVSQALYSSPGGDRGIYVGFPLAQVNHVDWSHAPTLTSQLDVTYGDPLPAEWPRVFDQRYLRSRYVRHPDAYYGGWVQMGITRLAPFAAPLPSTPDILPPSNVRVEGTPIAGGGRVSFDGTTPVTVSWSGVGTANNYVITIWRVYADGPISRSEPNGLIQTRETSVEIPAELFGGADFFLIDVGARRDGGNFARGDYWLQSFPFSVANVVSGLLRFSDTCGDGVVDRGEQCDPGAAETVACDVDCTFAECGDGLRNATAGEECDAIGFTTGCDIGCRRPVCGDGVRNPQVEDCDDGNTIDDGNGCDAACRANNVCGDGVVQAAVEGCDDGNTTEDGNGCDAACQRTEVCGDGIVQLAESCDTGGFDNPSCVGSTCRISACGDGHVNGAAAEQCDPPDGTTCSATCRRL